MDLSLILPAFNAEGYIHSTLDDLDRFFSHRSETYEIVVVDDGSVDSTHQEVERRSGDRVRLERHPRNRGKFAAIGTGMLVAEGRCRVFLDADLPYDLDAIPYMVELINHRGFHIVVGDRTLPDSEPGAPQPSIRRWANRTYRFLVRMIVTGGLFDTQCGLKGFRGDVADALFPVLLDPGFSGDVEALYIALKYNLEIRRIPVRLRNVAPSTVRVGRDSVIMLWRILGLRRRWLSGKYDSAELRRLGGQRYWKGPEQA